MGFMKIAKDIETQGPPPQELSARCTAGDSGAISRADAPWVHSLPGRRLLGENVHFSRWLQLRPTVVKMLFALAMSQA
jgi:hypothetical protein